MTLPVIVPDSPQYLPQGLKTGTIQKTIDLSTAAASFSIGTKPAGSVVASYAIKTSGTISATTATKLGIGRLTATADPDKYFLSGALTVLDTAAVLLATTTTDAAAEEIGLFACDNAGAAAGTVGGDGQYAQVLITYIQAETI